jgi:hypothetical protein
MPLVPQLRLDEPLERGQTTIFGALNGGLGIQRPLPPRPGLAPRASGQANTVLGRRLIGGQSKKDMLELFASVRLTQEEDGEPGDVDIINSRVIVDDDEQVNEVDYTPSKQYSYSREHKLAAIDYF